MGGREGRSRLGLGGAAKEAKQGCRSTRLDESGLVLLLKRNRGGSRQRSQSGNGDGWGFYSGDEEVQGTDGGADLR